MSMYRSRKRMENVDAQLEQKPSFEVKKTINQTPFKEEAVRSFFYKWCEINDSINPQIAPREYWEENIKKQGLLSKNPDGTRTLFIPNDIKLWEMVEVIEAIDKDTFANKPELREKKKQELLSLGKMFRNSGIYIAQRISSIADGKPIAEEMAREFFRYGNSLITGYMDQEQTEVPIETIATNNSLSFEEAEQVDKWLAGEKLYQSRLQRTKQVIDQHSPEEADQIIENQRQETLRQFFRVSEKAFSLERIQKYNSTIKDKETPWNPSPPIHSAFLKKIESRMEGSIEKPNEELISSIFRRGLDRLANDMERPPSKINLGILTLTFVDTGKGKLKEYVDVEKLKKELEIARKTKNVKEVSEKEIEITRVIQDAIGRFVYKEYSHNPYEMIKNRKINCLGATILGGTLFKELGINYLSVCLPRHAITVLITSDQRVFWQDLLHKAENFEIHDSDLDVNLNSRKKVTSQDIVSFSKNLSSESLPLKLSPKTYKQKVRWATNEDDNFFEIFPPEIGERALLLWNLGGILMKEGKIEEGLQSAKKAIKTFSSPSMFFDLGRDLYGLEKYEECIDYFQKTIAKNPNNYLAYTLLGNAYRNLEQYSNAIGAYRQATVINPNENDAYNGLGNTFWLLDRNDDALEMYQKAIKISPKFPHPHNGLANVFTEKGEYREAIREYRRFIFLADNSVDESLKKRAKEKIKELEDKLSQK